MGPRDSKNKRYNRTSQNHKGVGGLRSENETSTIQQRILEFAKFGFYLREESLHSRKYTASVKNISLGKKN